MQHEQPASLTGSHSGSELGAATRPGADHPTAARGREVGGSVGGTAVGDDDLMFECERGEILQEPREARGFVQRRDDYGQERVQLRTSVWNRARRSRVTGPGFPLPMVRPSSERIPTISLAVPVKKASSAV